MPWPKASPTPVKSPSIQTGTAVPSSEAIRLAALTASWARDRQLGRRRLAFRWLLWAWWRIGFPLLLALALAAGLLLQIPPSIQPAWLKPLVSSIGTLISLSTPPADALHSQKPTQAKEP